MGDHEGVRAAIRAHYVATFSAMMPKNNYRKSLLAAFAAVARTVWRPHWGYIAVVHFALLFSVPFDGVL